MQSSALSHAKGGGGKYIYCIVKYSVVCGFHLHFIYYYDSLLWLVIILVGDLWLDRCGLFTHNALSIPLPSFSPDTPIYTRIHISVRIVRCESLCIQSINHSPWKLKSTEWNSRNKRHFLGSSSNIRAKVNELNAWCRLFVIVRAQYFIWLNGGGGGGVLVVGRWCFVCAPTGLTIIHFFCQLTPGP